MPIHIQTYKSAEQLTAVIKADNLADPILGLAFDLTYDPTVLSYSYHEEGSFLEEGGDPIYLVTDQINHLGGQIVSGMTLRRNDQPVQGSGEILIVTFDILEEKNTELAFKNTIASTLNEQGDREDLSNVEWESQLIKFTQEEVIEIPEFTETGTGEVTEIETAPAPELQANIFGTEGTLLIALALISLPLTALICYIAWRQITRKNAAKKATNPSISEPEEETITYRSWT